MREAENTSPSEPTDADLASVEVAIAAELVAHTPGDVSFTEAVQRRIDDLESSLRVGIDCEALVEVPQQLRHVFTPGLYARELSLPRGTIVVTKIHNTEHPFVVSKGVVRVFIEGVGWETITAPYLGVTKPLTRRVALIVEDCVWTTFHPTDKTTPEAVESDVIIPRHKEAALSCHSQQSQQE